MKTSLAVLAVAMLLVTSFVSIHVAFANAQGGQVTLNPTDDTYIRAESPDSNQGSSEVLKASLYYYWTWLKFNLSSITEGALGITAVLELYTTYNGVTTPHAVVACLVLNNSWSESTLTAGNAPWSDDVELDTDYVVNVETWYEWNVTEAVVNATASRAGAVTTLMRYPWGIEAPSVSFNSKEASMTKKPKLTISWIDNIPEFPSPLILPLFIIAALLVVTVYRKKEKPSKPTFSFCARSSGLGHVRKHKYHYDRE